MAGQSRRARVLRAVTAILAVAVAGTGGWWLTLRHHGFADCPKVRAMMAYNKSQGQAFAAAFDPEQRSEPSVSDYQNWASRVRDYTASISQPDLAARASRLSDEAARLVSLVAQARSDTAVPADPAAPPPWARSYVDLSTQAHTELAALDKACPAG